MTSCVFRAVWPTYPATSPERSTSMSCPLLNTPIAAYSPPTSRATVVLPVPGLPRNTMCRLIGGTGRSFS